MPEPVYLRAGATFSEDRRHRYRLLRVWDDALPRVAFVMLNPSTADEEKLDPTLRRCLGFARSWGCGSFEVANLFAFRATSPKDMLLALDPVGPGNDEALIEVARAADFGVVAGWGVHGDHRNRAYDVVKMLTREVDLLCLAQTLGGKPGHPLYLPADSRPRSYRCREASAAGGTR